MTARPTLPAPRRLQGGGFMLEALIGILIFSFGILGLVGLQAMSIRHINDAQYRGEAVFLANAYIAQMWTDNPANLAARYEKGGANFDAFREVVKRLPGAELDTNEPVVEVRAGPTTSSSEVTVTLFWQLPGEPDESRHNYSTTAVVGLNP